MAPKKKAAEADNVIALDDHRARVEAFKARINKELKGHAQLKSASEYELPYLRKRLPTGILSLDIALKGGIPAGGVTMFTGPKNVGKSMMYWLLLSSLQKIYGPRARALLAMTELRADRSQARLLGASVAMSEADIQAWDDALANSGQARMTEEVKADLRRQVGTVDELHAESGEYLFDTVLRAIEENIYHLIIIDSFGSIMSQAEAEADSILQQRYGGSSRINTNFITKLMGLMGMDDSEGRPRDTFIVGVNQIRDAIGDPNKEFRSPGGKALEHGKLADIVVTPGPMRGENRPTMTPEGMKDRWCTTGKMVNWKIEKGKAGMHDGDRGSFLFDLTTCSPDFYSDAMVAGINSRVIETAGSWVNLIDPASGEVLLHVQGREAFLQALRDDEAQKKAAGDHHTLMEFIRKNSYRASDIKVTYDWRD